MKDYGSSGTSLTHVNHATVLRKSSQDQSIGYTKNA